MAKRKNMKCCVCFKDYKYCPHCAVDKDKPIWMFCFCCDNCHEIYETTQAFYDKRITREEAQAALSKLDLSEVNTLGESYRIAVAEILGTDTVDKTEQADTTTAATRKRKNSIKADDWNWIVVTQRKDGINTTIQI